MAFSIVQSLHKIARKFLEIKDEIYMKTLGCQYSLNFFEFQGITSSEGVLSKPIPTAVVS